MNAKNLKSKHMDPKQQYKPSISDILTILRVEKQAVVNIIYLEIWKGKIDLGVVWSQTAENQYKYNKALISSSERFSCVFFQSNDVTCTCR